jgi:antirestriction protein ArdC
MVVYASATVKNEGTEEEKRIPFLKAYFVFNEDQIDGLGERYATPAPITNEANRIAEVDLFFDSLCGRYQHGGNRAFYSPSHDFIQMPHATQFERIDNYYSTLAHEFIHWTGAKHRLNRTFGGVFGNPEYAAEELVAELGAAFMCGVLAINSEPRADHANYLASWLAVLKADKRAIFTAASKAQQAADYLQECAAAASTLAA